MMDAFKGKWERTSAENYEELLKVRLHCSVHCTALYTTSNIRKKYEEPLKVRLYYRTGLFVFSFFSKQNQLFLRKLLKVRLFSS